MFFHPAPDFRPFGPEQRAHHPGAVSHSPDSLEPSTSQKVEHQRLRIVVRIVGHGYGIEAPLAAQLPEPSVAQLPCRHLDADAFVKGVFTGVKTFDEIFRPASAAPFLHELRVSVGFFAAKTEVAVGYGNTGPGKKFRSPVCHIHRIYASADCEKDVFHRLLLIR